MCERTVLTVLKSFLSNVYQRRESCRRAEDGKILIFTSSGRRQPSWQWKVLLKIDFKTVNTVFSQTFNHKICFTYAIRRRSQLSGFFLTLKFSCLFTAVAVLQLDCLSSRAGNAMVIKSLRYRREEKIARLSSYGLPRGNFNVLNFRQRFGGGGGGGRGLCVAGREAS